MTIKTPDRVITRKEASKLNLRWYFTGKPCKRGHISTRNWNGSTCHACVRAARARLKGQVQPPTENRWVIEQRVKRAFHEQWLREFRARRAQRIADEKRRLELLS